MKTKAISFAYPSSTNAIEYGHGKTGCWHVERIALNRAPVAVRGACFPTKAEAIEHAEKMPEPWHPFLANNSL